MTGRFIMLHLVATSARRRSERIPIKMLIEMKGETSKVKDLKQRCPCNAERSH